MSPLHCKPEIVIVFRGGRFNIKAKSTTTDTLVLIAATG